MSPNAPTSPIQYDVVPIQSSVVICSCPHPSMVRNQPDSCSPLAIPGASSSHSTSMEGPTSESRAPGKPASLGAELRAQQAPQPRKKRPEDFKFGKILGEGSFSTVSRPAFHFSYELALDRCCYMQAFLWSYTPVTHLQFMLVDQEWLSSFNGI